MLAITTQQFTSKPLEATLPSVTVEATTPKAEEEVTTAKIEEETTTKDTFALVKETTTAKPKTPEGTVEEPT